QLTDTVRPHYAVDQGDKVQLAEIMDSEFPDDPIDLVIDDASHVWDKTVASFEVLYPRVRPGGQFVIEDWAAQYFIGDEMVDALPDPQSPRYQHLENLYEEEIGSDLPGRPPLARLGVALMLASAASPDVIAEITVNEHWISVVRGPAPLDRDSFRLEDHYAD